MFFVKEDDIWKKNYELQKTNRFKENPDLVFIEFINDNIKYIKKFNLNPYRLFFYSPISLNYKTNDIILITKALYSYIKNNNLNYTLNDTVSPLGFQEPLMSDFFYSSGSKVLDKQLVLTFIECGLIIDEQFYNRILRYLHYSSQYCIETKKTWDFMSFLSLLKESLDNVKLDDKNSNYLLEIANTNESDK